MAVHRRAAGRDHADELRCVQAPDVLVDQVPELPIGTGLERRLVRIPDRPALRIDRAARCLRGGDGDEHELGRARVLDQVALAGEDVGAHARLELVLLVLHVKRADTGGDIEELLPACEAPRLRPARREPDHVLLEVLGPVASVDRHFDGRRVDRSTTSSTFEGMSSTSQTSSTTPFSSTSTVIRAAISPYSP